MIEKAPCGACDVCEHCPFPDCTWDGVTRAEWDAAKVEDASARHFGESKIAAQQRAYYEANREKVAAYKRAYYEKHKEADHGSKAATPHKKEVNSMAMEKPGYRDVLERIRAESNGELVTVAEAAKITGYSKDMVTQRFDGWQRQGRAKRIPATVLARQLC